MSAPTPERSREEIRAHAEATLRWLDAEASDPISRAGHAWEDEHSDR